jgi:hypothetical protein
MTLKLYLISQTVNRGWDTYDSAVVVAETEEQAKHFHPSGGHWDDDDWTSPDNVQVVLLSENVSGDLQAGHQVVCASFNAG